LPQELVFLALEVEQLAPHPLEPLAELLEVLGAAYDNGHCKLTAAQSMDRLIDLSDRARDQDRKSDYQKDHHRDQGEQLPEQDALRPFGGCAHLLHLSLDEGVAAHVDDAGIGSKIDKALDALCKLGRRCQRVGQRLEDLGLSAQDAIERAFLLDVERQVTELPRRPGKLLARNAVCIEQRAVPEDHHLPCRAFHRRQELG